MPKTETRGGRGKETSRRRGADRSAMIAELFRAFPAKKFTLKALASAAGFVVLFIYAIQAVAYVKVFFVDKADE